ncbi:MAG: phosphoribosylglycinamide formyltransferase [Cellvibrionales bacterium TMED49]|nr:phosphoribosylglycinamide formyltransferase [Porticoccaceae bacterium]OUU39305.1 MAG: phosphoribosylglycinamide formyltransferase [Cellvibrionales bacterium TMED49]
MEKNSATNRIVILISGNGTNLQSIINARSVGELNAEIVAVISDRRNVFGLERAKLAGIPTITLEHTQFGHRDEFDLTLAKTVAKFNPTLILLSGFMRVLGNKFLRHFQRNIINIHPSLLPKYKGLKTHQRAIEAGDSFAGATVHFVNEYLDAGPCILQAKVKIGPDENCESLAKRVLKMEHIIFPLAVQWFCDRRLALKNGIAIFDGIPLPKMGQQFKNSSSILYS